MKSAFIVDSTVNDMAGADKALMDASKHLADAATKATILLESEKDGTLRDWHEVDEHINQTLYIIRNAGWDFQALIK